MALNLITPRYIAPDVTKAAVAGEQIQSSMARTSLAERQLGEQQRKAKVGESLSERQFGLSERELALRAEAQGVSLASQRQAMRHKEEKLPLEIRDMNASLISQQLDNALARDTYENNVLASELEIDATLAQIAESSERREEAKTNMLHKQEDRKWMRENRDTYTQTMDKMHALENNKDWEGLRNFDMPGELPPNLLAGLEKMRQSKLEMPAALDYQREVGFESLNAQAEDTAELAATNKLSSEVRALFSLQEQQGEDGWVDGNGRRTMKGNVALNRYNEYNKINATEWMSESQAAKLMAPSSIPSAIDPRGGADTRYILDGRGKPTNTVAGKYYNDGEVFIPSKDMLSVLKIAAAEAEGKFTSQFAMTEIDYDKGGYKIKAKKSGKTYTPAEALTKAKMITDQYNALIETGEWTGNNKGALAKAMQDVDVADGSITGLRTLKETDDFFAQHPGKVFVNLNTGQVGFSPPRGTQPKKKQPGPADVSGTKLYKGFTETAKLTKAEATELTEYSQWLPPAIAAKGLSQETLAAYKKFRDEDVAVVMKNIGDAVFGSQEWLAGGKPNYIYPDEIMEEFTAIAKREIGPNATWRNLSTTQIPDEYEVPAGDTAAGSSTRTHASDEMSVGDKKKLLKNLKYYEEAARINKLLTKVSKNTGWSMAEREPTPAELNAIIRARYPGYKDDPGIATPSKPHNWSKY